ncbi:hypothetical protein [Bradyrhizobium sp. DOA9]|uniref:hypothetical protein n=1 Tax=Bradyrhizobium sp. DOA9 TaxID=1126627 RepID=UPI0004684DBD|nr:hypothetical protein [Bradyrhizobium sp. DOA9]GAJ37590.1 hypothetical protein BDOA9_0202080 [Bradyrhizobium sp. DOA9]
MSQVIFTEPILQLATRLWFSRAIRRRFTASRTSRITLRSASAAPRTIIGSLKDPNVKGLERAEPFKEVVDGKQVVNYSSFGFRPEDKGFRDLIDQGLAQKNREGVIAKTIMSFGFPGREATPTDVTAKELCGSVYR